MSATLAWYSTAASLRRKPTRRHHRRSARCHGRSRRRLLVHRRRHGRLQCRRCSAQRRPVGPRRASGLIWSRSPVHPSPSRTNLRSQWRGEQRQTASPTPSASFWSILAAPGNGTRLLHQRTRPLCPGDAPVWLRTAAPSPPTSTLDEKGARRRMIITRIRWAQGRLRPLHRGRRQLRRSSVA